MDLVLNDHIEMKIWNSKSLPPQPLGMWPFWSIGNRIISLFFVVRWSCFNPYLWPLPPSSTVLADSWTVVFLSHAKATTTSLRQGVILGFRFLSVVLAEESRDVTTRRRRRRRILDARLGNNPLKKHLRAFLWFIPFTQPPFAHSLHLIDSVTPEIVLWEERRGIQWHFFIKCN